MSPDKWVKVGNVEWAKEHVEWVSLCVSKRSIVSWEGHVVGLADRTEG